MYSIFFLNFTFKCNYHVYNFMQDVELGYTCIRHPDVHNFTYNCIFVRLLYTFVYNYKA